MTVGPLQHKAIWSVTARIIPGSFIAMRTAMTSSLVLPHGIGCVPLGPVRMAPENLASPGFETRTVQTVSSRFTDYVTPAAIYWQ